MSWFESFSFPTFHMAIGCPGQKPLREIIRCDMQFPESPLRRKGCVNGASIVHRSGSHRWRMFNIVQLLCGGTKSRFGPQYVYIYRYTSSTAQGGSGSFKDRKPIGEVGCCESWMAERIHWWTERWLERVFFGVVGMVVMVTSPTTAGCSVV